MGQSVNMLLGVTWCNGDRFVRNLDENQNLKKQTNIPIVILRIVILKYQTSNSCVFLQNQHST